jgi:hypothetical protein
VDSGEVTTPKQRISASIFAVLGVGLFLELCAVSDVSERPNVRLE